MGSRAARRTPARSLGRVASSLSVGLPTGSAVRMAASSSSLRPGVEQLVALKSDIERASAEPLFHLHANCRARQERHWPRQLLERPVSVGDAQPGDVVERAVLQLVAGSAVEDRVAERNIFGTIEPLEKLIGQFQRKLAGEDSVHAQCGAQEIRADANAVE